MRRLNQREVSLGIEGLSFRGYYNNDNSDSLSYRIDGRYVIKEVYLRYI